MLKVKIFICDDKMLGMPSCSRYLNGQTYCFALDTGPGFGLFINKKKTRVALLKDDAWKGCVGELWEVSEDVRSSLDDHYLSQGDLPSNMILPATGMIQCWITLPIKIRGAKMRVIKDYRDTRW